MLLLDSTVQCGGIVTNRLDRIRAEIVAHDSNAWARELDYEPVHSVAPGARIAIIGQAPGRKARPVACRGTTPAV